MIELELVRRTKDIVKNLETGRIEEAPYCRKTIRWQLNGFGDKAGDRDLLEEKMKEHFEGKKIVPGYFTAEKQTKGDYLATGNFCVYKMSELPSVGYHTYEYHAVLAFADGIVDKIMLFGDCTEEIFRIVRVDEEHIYMMRESEIRYVDCYRNNCIWHCTGYSARERQSLKNLEMILPGTFIRISQSCIVNTMHISEIGRYEVRMDNGEILYTSRRSYGDVKKRIREIIDRQAAHNQNANKSACFLSSHAK